MIYARETRPTWWFMARFNLPCSGSKVLLHSHLDTYGGGKGDVIWVGWGKEGDVSIQNAEKTAGCYCRKTQFEGCEWEYMYDETTGPLQWPRAEYKGHSA